MGKTTGRAASVLSAQTSAQPIRKPRFLVPARTIVDAMAATKKAACRSISKSSPADKLLKSLTSIFERSSRQSRGVLQFAIIQVPKVFRPLPLPIHPYRRLHFPKEPVRRHASFPLWCYKAGEPAFRPPRLTPAHL